MTVFGDYSRYYDLLYRDKDYAGETEYIASMMRCFRPEARRVIELGAGTGRHAGLLSRKGYVVHGVESSSEMFAQARLLYAGDATLAFTNGTNGFPDARRGRRADIDQKRLRSGPCAC